MCEHKLILLEDACQSIGATYKGKSLGTIGDAGTFSFDFVKTITCAEGGVVMTNNEDIYIKSDGYTDHGHDHQGADRGADLHPFLDTITASANCMRRLAWRRIRKLDTFLGCRKKITKHYVHNLEQIPEISFA